MTSAQPLSYIEALQRLSTQESDTAARYKDLALPARVVAQVRVTGAGAEALRLDADGNGNFETQINPTYTATGVAARDTNPLLDSISAAKRQ